VRAALTAQDMQQVTASYWTAVQSVQVISAAAGSGTPDPLPALLEGSETAYGYQLSGAPWGSQPEGVYVPAFSGLAPGSRLRVTLADGRARELTVVGQFAEDRDQVTLNLRRGLLLPAAASLRLAPADSVQFYAAAPAGQLAAASAALGRALPQATVINLVAYLARFTLAYHNLFLLAVVMAGLALLAGVLLVANSVTLSMLDRRYEIGVLKAIGYTRAQVQVTLALEYILMAAIASGAGLLVVQIFLWVLGRANSVAAGILRLDPLTALAIGAVGVGLALLAVLASTWGPTGAAPAQVLYDRD
jgi:putative ABC transport system permease protein